MSGKFVPIQVSSVDWAKFSVRVAQDAEKLLQEGTPKNLNRSNVVSTLLEGFLDKKYPVEPISQDAGEKGMKGVVINVDIWKRARDYITNMEAKGEKVKGGLGGLVVALVRAYNSEEISVF